MLVQYIHSKVSDLSMSLKTLESANNQHVMHEVENPESDVSIFPRFFPPPCLIMSQRTLRSLYSVSFPSDSAQTPFAFR